MALKVVLLSIVFHIISAVGPYFYFARRFSSSTNEVGDLDLMLERLLSPMHLGGHFMVVLFALNVLSRKKIEKVEDPAELDFSDRNLELLNWLTAIGMEKYYPVLIENKISMKEMNAMSQSGLQKIIKNGDDARDILAEFMKLP